MKKTSVKTTQKSIKMALSTGTRNEIFAKKCIFMITSFQEAAYSYPQTDYTQVKQEREHQKKYSFFFPGIRNIKKYLCFFQTSAYGNVNYDPAYNNYYDYSLVFLKSNQKNEQQQKKPEKLHIHTLLTLYSPLCPWYL